MSFLGGLAGGAIGGAVVNLYLDDKNFQAGLAGAEAKTKGATGAMGKGFSTLSKLGITSFAAIGVAALAGAAKAVEAASDQEEALNKARVVFGATSGEIEKFADTAATAMGLSKTAALSAAGTFGNFFTAAGLADSAVTDLSKGVVTLASDLASFNNIGTDEALEKLRAGLAGEAEPLRTVGVFLSEARVSAEAYKTGVAEVGEELTDAQKIQTRYNLIMQDTALAQGDFARTSDGLANQQRILSAEMENFAADVGQALIPAATGLVSTFSDLVPVVQDLSTLVVPLISSFKTLLFLFIGYKAVQWLPEFLFQVGAGLQSMGAKAAGGAAGGAAFGVNKVSKALGNLGGPIMLGVTAAVLEATALFDNFSISLDHVAEKSIFTADQLKHIDDNLSFTSNLTSDVSFGGFIGMLDGTRDQVEGLSQALTPLQADFKALGLSVDGTNAYFAELVNSYGTEAGTSGSIAEMQDRLSEQIDLLDTYGEQLGKGGYDLDTYISRVMQLGFSHEDATRLADTALDRYGQHLETTGKIVQQFAGMSDDELKDFREQTKEAFNVSSESVIGFKRKFEGSVHSFLAGLANMAGQVKDRLADMRELNTIHIGDSIKEFLLTQGPDAIHRFVEANREGREKAVGHINAILEGEKKLGGEIDTATGKADNLTGAMDKLGRKKANPTVTFQYKFSDEDGALAQFLDLKGAGT